MHDIDRSVTFNNPYSSADLRRHSCLGCVLFTVRFVMNLAGDVVAASVGGGVEPMRELGRVVRGPVLTFSGASGQAGSLACGGEAIVYCRELGVAEASPEAGFGVCVFPKVAELHCVPNRLENMMVCE